MLGSVTTKWYNPSQGNNTWSIAATFRSWPADLHRHQRFSSPSRLATIWLGGKERVPFVKDWIAASNSSVVFCGFNDRSQDRRPLRAMLTPETAGYFLFHLKHSNRPFRLIVVTKSLWLRHKMPDLLLMFYPSFLATTHLFLISILNQEFFKSDRII